MPPNTHKDVYHFSFLQHSQKVQRWLFLFCMLLCASCDSPGNQADKIAPVMLQRGEYISRLHDEFVQVPLPEKKNLLPYPWKRKSVGTYPQITKGHFRCKGKCTNPDKLIQQSGESVYLQDCGGCEQHSLPLNNKKEFIYPILINLLNYVQAREKKQVYITSGHRCPDHNRYNDSSSKNQCSKHMIGAEVSFYVIGRENAPETIVNLLKEYFFKNPDYHGLLEYQEFNRWEKPDLDTSTLPWYNKEVFIKIYRANEGRNWDNDHSFPYISIQVRYDRSAKEKVFYSWDKAFRNFWRY